jgi:CDP-paratose 2-epimerase
MKKKILITGGCGFLGSNIAFGLKDSNYEIYILDNLSRLGGAQNLERLQQNVGVQFHKLDIRDAASVEQLISEIVPDVVFHLAGQVAMTTSIQNPRQDFEINAMGTLNVLEGLRKYATGAVIIYSSTNKVYGDLEKYHFEENEKRYFITEKPNGFDESEQLDFHSPYGCSKGSADQYMLDYARLFGIRSIVFRHSTIYGSHQYATFDQGWIGWFCQKALETKNNTLTESFSISGNGKQVRDVLNAVDAVNLYISCIDHAEALKGKVFNIGGGMTNSLSLLELFDILESELQVRLNYIKLPPRESDQKLFVADISKISDAINWKPKMDKVSGIRQMLDWLANASV